MNIETAQQILHTSKGHPVAVSGDLMLDEWIMGDARRISPEAPVPVVRFAERRTAPGGAANVAMNLMSLGAAVSVVGVVGHDDGGDDLRAALDEAGAATEGIIRDHSRCTTQKTRIIAQNQQMVRVDREDDAPFSQPLQQQLQSAIAHQMEGAKLLCISEYDKGIAAGDVVKSAIRQAMALGMKITAGPKPRNLPVFEGADFVSLNEKEASEAAGFALDDEAALQRAGKELQEKFGFGALVITRGARGAALFQNNGSSLSVAAHRVEVFDVAGAGDTFLAAATMAILAGEDCLAACELGNLAAAASVCHVGVRAVQLKDLLRIASLPS